MGELPNKDKLQQILEERIGYGYGQKKLLRPIYLLLFSEGSESIILGILIPELGKQWGIGVFEKSLLITVVYIGVAFGSYLQNFSDIYGRYPFLVVDASITIIFGITSAFSTSLTSFIILRFFYGIGMGIALPLTATYITEMLPKSQRGSIIALSRICWAIGSVCCCIIAWLLLSVHQWRLVLVIICIPNLIALIDMVKNGKESLRYLWIKNHKQQCKQLLDYLAIQNNRIKISREEMNYSMQEFQLNHQSQQEPSLKQIFNKRYLKMTLFLLFAWGAGGFISYSMALILPSILERHQDMSHDIQYLFMVIVSSFEIFAFVLSKIMMDNPSLGRKKSIWISAVIVLSVSVLIIIFGENSEMFILLIFIAMKVFSLTWFNILNPYSTEIYETKIRSRAMGILSISARLSTAVMGAVGISALSWFAGYGLYYIFIVLSAITALLIYKMPYCTLGRQLDT